MLSSAEVLCTTNIGAGHFTIANRKFSIVLIDEATQATEPSALVPIVKGARQLILVGDHKQLPPTVTSRSAEDGGEHPIIREVAIKWYPYPHVDYTIQDASNNQNFHLQDSTIIA